MTVRVPAETPAWRAKYDEARSLGLGRRLFVYRLNGHWYFAGSRGSSWVRARDSRRKTP